MSNDGGSVLQYCNSIRSVRLTLSQAHHNSYPKSQWPKHFGDCDVLYSAVDLYSIHMFMHTVNLIPTYLYLQLLVSVCVRMFVTETEVACTRPRMYFALWPVNIKICRGETRVYEIEMMLALSSE